MSERNYPHEKWDLKQATDEELAALAVHKQFFNYGERLFGLDLLVDEIRFSRYWVERMDKDRKVSDEALGRSLKREMALCDLFRKVRTDLELSLSYCPVTEGSPDIEPAAIEAVIKQIDDIMNGEVPE